LYLPLPKARFETPRVPSTHNTARHQRQEDRFRASGQFPAPKPPFCQLIGSAGKRIHPACLNYPTRTRLLARGRGPRGHSSARFDRARARETAEARDDWRREQRPEELGPHPAKGTRRTCTSRSRRHVSRPQRYRPPTIPLATNVKKTDFELQDSFLPRNHPSASSLGRQANGSTRHA
jgi:hypothetical protein